MPWDAAGMQAKNHSLTAPQSLHAAHIANAILRRTGDEGLSIATANKLAHRDTGGMTPGLAPSNTTEQPIEQNYIQRFAALPVEQLQELIPRLGNSPLASIAARVLQSKRVAPQAQQQQAPVQVPTQARGGMIPRRASGGSSSVNEWLAPAGSTAPTQTAAPAVAPPPPKSTTIGYGPTSLGGGFTPPVQTLPNPGSAGVMTTPQQKTSQYLADNGTVNGTGQSTAKTLGTGVNASTGMGSSQSGNAKLDNYLNATEGGASFTAPAGYVPPSPPTSATTVGAPGTTPFTVNVFGDPIPGYAPGSSEASNAASGGGGGFDRGGGMRLRSDTVPILAAGGEFTINPDFVAKVGDGDIALGHKRLDAWVVAKRKEIIREMMKLKPPVKS